MRLIAKKIKILMFKVSVFIVYEVHEKAMCQNRRKKKGYLFLNSVIVGDFLTFTSKTVLRANNQKSNMVPFEAFK